MTNDSGLFKTRAELEAEGFYLVPSNRLRKGEIEFAPLYVGKTIHQFDHRAASVTVNEDALHVSASSNQTSSEEHRNPVFNTSPQFWVDVGEVNARWPKGLEWAIGFRDIARVTDVRTCIASLIPRVACGNTLPILLPVADKDVSKSSAKKADQIGSAEKINLYKSCAPLLLANLSSIALDYIARQKVQSTHLNWYIVEQFPVVPAELYDAKIGKQRIGDFIRQEVLHLTYTAIDMKPFARDMGYEGKPFQWDEDDRLHRRARLDALFFKLYGISPKDVPYILDTFPIMREEDESKFGSFVTKDLILGYMRALEAGDLKSRVVIPHH